MKFLFNFLIFYAICMQFQIYSAAMSNQELRELLKDIPSDQRGDVEKRLKKLGVKRKHFDNLFRTIFIHEYLDLEEERHLQQDIQEKCSDVESAFLTDFLQIVKETKKRAKTSILTRQGHFVAENNCWCAR